MLVAQGAVAQDIDWPRLRLGRSGVLVQALVRRSTQGTIIRLREVGGRAEPVDLSLPGVTRATLTDLVERGLSPLPVQGDSFRVELRAYGYAAVRVE